MPPHRNQHTGLMAAVVFTLMALAPCCGFAATIEQAIPPATASDTSPAPLPAAGNGTQRPIPAGFLREILNIRYRDCREILSQVDRSFDPKAGLNPLDADDLTPGPASGEGRNNGKPNPPVYQPPTHLLSLLPETSQILPYLPTNSLIVISTPDGVKTAKLLIEGADTRPHNILVRLSVVSLEPAAAPAAGQPGASSPDPLTIAAPPEETTVHYLGTSGEATMADLAKAGKVRILSTLRIILPENTEGILTDVTAANGLTGKQPSADVDAAIGTRLNPDGTITLYARIETASEAHSGALNLPGIRLANGDTLLIERGRAATACAICGKLQQPGATVLRPAKRILYLLTVNVVDCCGGIIPNSGDSVRDELMKIEPEGAPDEETRR